MATNINDLIDDMKDISIRLFKDTSSKFIEKLENSESHKHFIGLVKLQAEEVLSALKIEDAACQTSADSTSAVQMSKVCSSNSLKSPKSSLSKIDLSQIKKFSPLVNDGNKIRCTAPWCTSKFSHKRSYDKHMSRFHRNLSIDPTITDPPGTCELLTAGKPCRAALCERAMMYHLEHIHGVHRPEDHFLYGFNTSSDIPSAVFVPNSHRYEAKKTSALNIRDVIIISQNVKKGSKKSYPMISQRSNTEAIIDDTTPKQPKAVKRKRIRFRRSSSDSSLDNSYQGRKEKALSTPKRIRKDENDDIQTSIMKASLTSGSKTQTLTQSVPSYSREASVELLKYSLKEEKSEVVTVNSVPSYSREASVEFLKYSVKEEKSEGVTDEFACNYAEITIDDDSFETFSQPLLNEESTKDVMNLSSNDIVLSQCDGKVESKGDPSQSVSPEREKKSSSHSSTTDDSSSSSSQCADNSSKSQKDDPSEKDKSCEENDNLSQNSSDSNDDDLQMFVQEFEDYNETLANTSFTDDSTKNISQDDQPTDDDSDIEEGDGDLYTIIRRRNRDIRYNNRNVTIIPLHERDENRLFIEDFKQFIQKFSVTPANRKMSTIDKACSHLFIQDDSFLNYEFKLNPEFTLENLRNFTAKSFENLKYPGDWITETAGNNGNKGSLY